MRGLLVRLFAVCLFAASSPTYAQNSTTVVGYVPGEFLIRLRPNVSIDALRQRFSAANIEITKSFDRIRIAKVVVKDAQLARELAFRSQSSVAAASSSDVDFIEPNYIYRIAAENPRPAVSLEQWHLAKVKAPDGWKLQPEASNILVALIDTGVMIDHANLKESIWTNPNPGAPSSRYPGDKNGWNFRDGTADASPELVSKLDENGFPSAEKVFEAHGTHVAGLIGAVANQAAGVSGVAAKVRIMPLKVLGGSWAEGTNADILEALEYALAHNARIINLSFGGPELSRGIDQAIADAHSAGVLVIAAAGNGASGSDGTFKGYDVDNQPFYPASYVTPNVLAVAASDANDSLAQFSNFGKRTVHLAAPGLRIVSTIPELVGLNQRQSGYGELDGTSMATPIVAGAAALLMAHNPTLTHVQIKRLLVTNVDFSSFLETRVGSGGRLNVAKALTDPQFAKPRSSAVPTTAVTTAASAASAPIQRPTSMREAMVPRKIDIQSNPTANANSFILYLNKSANPGAVKSQVESLAGPVTKFEQKSDRQNAYQVDLQTSHEASKLVPRLNELTGVNGAELNATVRANQ